MLKSQAIICLALTLSGAAGCMAEESAKAPDAVAFDGQRAYEHLEHVCALGPRPSGSAAMKAQQKYAAAHFAKHGAKVRLQRFRVRHPRDGSPVEMGNLVAQWHPQRRARILFCAHYDTRPYPDRDPHNPRGRFVGANDGASGVAVLMELATHLETIAGDWGVDCVLFDGEEFVFGDSDRYFLGSEYFAQQYAQGTGRERYRWGVLLDMVGDADLQIFQEANSVGWPDVAPLVRELWSTAQRLGVKEFVPQTKHLLRDDHLPLHDIGGIAICDVIDFDYPHWHTEADTVEHCSAESLEKVGRVVATWLRDLPAP